MEITNNLMSITDRIPGPQPANRQEQLSTPSRSSASAPENRNSEPTAAQATNENGASGQTRSAASFLNDPNLNASNASLRQIDTYEPGGASDQSTTSDRRMQSLQEMQNQRENQNRSGQIISLMG